MGQREILCNIVSLLNNNHIPYLLTGSFAVSYYGIPRATHDIDFLIEININNYFHLKKAIDSLDKSYLVDIQQMEEAIKKSSQFNILNLDSGIKIDFWLAEENNFEVSKIKRGITVALFQQKINLISPEDLILTKLLWCKKIRSDRHIRDCIGIWKIQGENLDKKYLKIWVKRLNIEKYFQEMQKIDLEKYL